MGQIYPTTKKWELEQDFTAAKYFNSWFNDHYGFAEGKKKQQKEEKSRNFPVYIWIPLL